MTFYTPILPGQPTVGQADSNAADATGLTEPAMRLYEKGWQPFGLPPNEKAPPPTDFTGAKGHDRDAPKYLAALQGTFARQWAAGGNIGLRLGELIFGIDVDDYVTEKGEAKAGGAALAALEEVLGTLPPTVIVSSRLGDDESADPRYISGIRLFRLPTPLDPDRPVIDGWSDIEVIRHGHRYIVAPASMHPRGTAYQTLDQSTGEMSETLPAVEDLPMLPDQWVEAVYKDSAAGLVAERKSTRANRRAGGSGYGSRHAATRDQVLAKVMEAEPREAIEALRKPFIDLIGADRADADAEFGRFLDGAYTLREKRVAEMRDKAAHAGLGEAEALEVAEAAVRGRLSDEDLDTEITAWAADPEEARRTRAYKEREWTAYTNRVGRTASGLLALKSAKNLAELTRGPLDPEARLVNQDGEVVGWTLVAELSPEEGGTYRTAIRVGELAGAPLASWNTQNHDVFLLPPRVALAPYFRWRGSIMPEVVGTIPGSSTLRNVQLMTATTGEVLWSSKPIKEQVWVDKPQFWKVVPRDDASIEETYDRVADLLSFRELEESGPALAIVGALTVPAQLEAERLVGGAVKVGSIAGIAQTGKTTWLKLATRIFGYVGSGSCNITVAAFARHLEAGGLVYLDDISTVKDNKARAAILELARGMATDGSRDVADRDSKTGSLTQAANAGLLMSNEMDPFGNTRAELDRRIVFTFRDTKVSERTDLVDGKPVKQWGRMLRLGAKAKESNTAGIDIMNRHAANLLTSLSRELADLEQHKLWRAHLGERELIPVFGPHAVGLALANGLERHGHPELAAELRIVIETWAMDEMSRRVEIKETKSDLAVVKMLEAYSRSDSWRRSSWALQDIADASKLAVTNGVLTAQGYVSETAMFPVVVLRIAGEPKLLGVVVTNKLAAWGSTDEARRVGVTDENTGTSGRELDDKDVGEQLGELDSPDWAPENGEFRPRRRVLPPPPNSGNTWVFGSRCKVFWMPPALGEHFTSNGGIDALDEGGEA